MKLDTLKKECRRIEREVKSERIIQRAIGITRKYGGYENIVHSYHTSAKGNFSGLDYRGKKIEIDYNDGLSMFGGGSLNIDYNGKSVFEADRSENLPSEKNVEGISIKVEGFYIHKFIPGNWQSQLKLLAANGPKKKKLEEKVTETVDKATLSELRERLPIR